MKDSDWRFNQTTTFGTHLADMCAKTAMDPAAIDAEKHSKSRGCPLGVYAIWLPVHWVLLRSPCSRQSAQYELPGKERNSIKRCLMAALIMRWYLADKCWVPCGVEKQVDIKSCNHACSCSQFCRIETKCLPAGLIIEVVITVAIYLYHVSYRVRITWPRWSFILCSPRYVFPFPWYTSCFRCFNCTLHATTAFIASRGKSLVPSSLLPCQVKQLNLSYVSLCVDFCPCLSWLSFVGPCSKHLCMRGWHPSTAHLTVNPSSPRYVDGAQVIGLVGSVLGDDKVDLRVSDDVLDSFRSLIGVLWRHYLLLSNHQQSFLSPFRILELFSFLMYYNSAVDAWYWQVQLSIEDLQNSFDEIASKRQDVSLLDVTAKLPVEEVRFLFLLLVWLYRL